MSDTEIMTPSSLPVLNANMTGHSPVQRVVPTPLKYKTALTLWGKEFDRDKVLLIFWVDRLVQLMISTHIWWGSDWEESSWTHIVLSSNSLPKVITSSAQETPSALTTFCCLSYYFELLTFSFSFNFVNWSTHGSVSLLSNHWTTWLCK